jgi:hypothetical protein
MQSWEGVIKSLRSALTAALLNIYPIPLLLQPPWSKRLWHYSRDMSELEPLFVRYLDETIKVDPTGSKSVADLIVKTKKEFAPELDSFSLCKLTQNKRTT